MGIEWNDDDDDDPGMTDNNHIHNDNNTSYSTIRALNKKFYDLLGEELAADNWKLRLLIRLRPLLLRHSHSLLGNPLRLLTHEIDSNERKAALPHLPDRQRFDGLCFVYWERYRILLNDVLQLRRRQHRQRGRRQRRRQTPQREYSAYNHAGQQ